MTRSLSVLAVTGSGRVVRGSALLRPEVKLLSAGLTGGRLWRLSVLREGLDLMLGLVRL